MPKRRQSVEIYSPSIGIKSDQMPELLDPRAAASAANMKCYFGVNQKEYGTSMWCTSPGAFLSGPPMMLFAATFPSISVLEVATPTKIFQYVGGSDSYANDGQTYTGTYTDFWSGCMFADKFIFTNGKDPMQFKSAYNATATNLPSAVSPTTFNAWCVQGLNAFVNLYHVFENGTEFYKRVRWSAQAPLTYIAGTTDFASGLAGAQDIDDGEGNLMQAVPLAGGMVLYFENSIHFQSFIGGDAVWQFQKMIPGVGIPSRRAALGYQEVNFFLTNNNVYRYYGGYYLDPIGNDIKQALFGEINKAALNTVWLDYDKQEAELLINIPTSTATQPNVTWVYRVLDKTWSRKIRSHSSGAVYGKQIGKAISDLVGNIGAQNYPFSAIGVTVDAYAKLYGDVNGYVVKSDITLYSQSVNGTSTAQAYFYDTPDITGNKEQDPVDGSHAEFVVTNQRWQRVSAELAGNGSVHVLYSTDHGQSFKELDQSPVTLTPSATTYQLDMDVNNPFIRVRLTNTGLNEYVAVRYLKLDFLPGQQF